MSGKTRFITVCALLAALSAASLYISSVLPTGQLGFAALASLFGVAATAKTGLRGGLAVYICSLILGLLLTADKTPAVLYGLFFGYYPLLKSFAERRHSRIAEWIIKLAVMNAALTAIILLLKTLVFDIQSFTENFAVIYIAANVIYIIFDIGVTRALPLICAVTFGNRRGRK